MSRRVVLSVRATKQIDQSAEWWAHHRSIEQASRWLAEIHDAIAQLAERAEMFPTCPDAKPSSRDIREMLFGLSGKVTHRVIYSLTDERVMIIAVRHVAQRCRKW